MATLEDGQQFGRYRIIRFLSASATGEGYEAEDRSFHRKVMLKLIHPWSILPEPARRQFFREMHGISSLHHPYLATVTDYGEYHSTLYIARRFLTLGSLLGPEGRTWYQAPFPVDDAIRYAHQLGQALQHVHHAGFLHGGLSLANILILRESNYDREPGFAPFLLADIGTTHFVRRFGRSRTYPLPITTAPEQLGGRAVAASDQYALAAILYYWLAGRPPFLGTPEEVEQLKLSETISPLTRWNSRVTLEQEALVQRALRVYPDERFPSVSAFTVALLATITSCLNQQSLPEKTVNLTYPFSEDEEHEEPLLSPSVTPLTFFSYNEQEPTLPPIEPTPQTPPDVPQPLPEPETPTPLTPEPDPDQPVHPDPLPEPEPDAPTPPAPDIPQPLPDPQQPPSDPTQPMDLHEGLQQAEHYEPPTTEPLVAAAAVQFAHLIITSQQESSRVLLEREEITIGRAGSSDILLDGDELVSRHHALLRQEGEHYVLYDRRSTHGIFVNGQKLAENTGHRLQHDDHITIGNFTLIYSRPTRSILEPALSTAAEQ